MNINTPDLLYKDNAFAKPPMQRLHPGESVLCLVTTKDPNYPPFVGFWRTACGSWTDTSAAVYECVEDELVAGWIELSELRAR